MATQCDRCENYFIVGINGGTFIHDNGIEEILCNYCSDDNT